MNKKPLAVLLAAGLFAGAWASVGSVPAVAQDSTEKPAVFTEAYLNDPAKVEAGKAVWENHCRLCHGYAAYPSTVPKLKPGRYNADFVFDWVTYGYRNMPAFQEVYTREERMNVVTYVLSKEFSP